MTIQQPVVQQSFKEQNEERNKLECQQLEEILKNLLWEHKRLGDVEKKLGKWKQEGYDVSELEQMLEEVKSE